MELEIGCKVVYPNQGVCEVQERCQRNIAGRDEEFLVLRILSNDSTVMIPSSNVDNVGLRPLADEGDLKKLFRLLESDGLEPEQDWKNRYKENLEKMKSGCLFEVGQVLRHLHFLGFQKPLSFREKKMYDRARALVISEIAAVRAEDQGEVEAGLEKQLEKVCERLSSLAAV